MLLGFGVTILTPPSLSSPLPPSRHKVQQYTNGLAKDTTAELRTFKSLPAPPGEEGRGWRMQQDRLTKQFTQVCG